MKCRCKYKRKFCISCAQASLKSLRRFKSRWQLTMTLVALLGTWLTPLSAQASTAQSRSLRVNSIPGNFEKRSSIANLGSFDNPPILNIVNPVSPSLTLQNSGLSSHVQSATNADSLNVVVRDGMPYTATPVANWPAIVSQSAVVVDLNTGTVIYGKDPLARHYPASITKILTALIALQRGHLTDRLTTSKLAAEQGGNRVYLVPGEVEPLEKLLYGLMLNSGNDAAVVIAQKYGGSVSHFAEMMNEEAVALGATHSHFDNPNGMPDPNHWTTAYDMGRITEAAMKIPEFDKIVSTKTYKWTGKDWTSTLVNLNHMLFTYPGAIGVKTGFTMAAHETLVVAAKRGNQTFLAVLMDAPLDAQIRNDATQLLNFAFAHYRTQTVLPKGSVVAVVKNPDGTANSIVTDAPCLATVPIGHSIQTQVHLGWSVPKTSMPANSPVGILQVSQNGQELSTNLPVVLKDPYTLHKAPPIDAHPFELALLFAGGALALVLLVSKFRARPEPGQSGP